MSNPTRFLPSTLIDWLEVCAKVLIIAGALVGAGWAYFEYVQKEHQQRIEASLGYVKRFSEGALFESTKRIANAWYGNQQVLSRLQHASSEAAHRQRHRQLVMNVVERVSGTDKDGRPTYGIADDVDTVVSFFSELMICIRADLCDRKSAHAYFDNYARRFYCLHEPYLNWRAANYASDFGKDLAEFATRTPQDCQKS